MSQHRNLSHNKNHFNNTSTTSNSSSNQLSTNHSYQTILANDIPLTYSEADLYSIFSRYGHVNKIQKLSNLSYLIEFANSNSSTALIQKYKSNPYIIGGSHHIRLEYANQSIQPSASANFNDLNVSKSNTTSYTIPTDNSTNILNANISNVKYPITVDIIRQICQKFGRLLRIFIGKKTPENVVEALIEYEKISEARAAKEALHGEDIYSGCCSLDVKYSKISSVPVLKNDEESWDFTINPVSMVIKPGILKSPPVNGTISTVPILSAHANITSATQQQIFQGAPVYPIYNYPPPPMYQQVPISPFPCRPPPFDHQNLVLSYSAAVAAKSSSKNKVKLDINKTAFVVEIGVVFMVYNLPFSICVDHLFNLFCLYGNINKIRFLPNQPGVAMVQMGSRTSADSCIQHYNNRVLFGQEMRLLKCSKPEIFVSKNLEYLPNGTPAFKDFSNDANNRFLNDHAISSNKILEPNRTLHFFNAPYTFGESDLHNMIVQSGVPRPLNVIIFSNKSDQIKKCIGLFEFHRLDDALVALSVLNHKPIIIPDTNQVFHMKLTFSAREPKNPGQNHSFPDIAKRSCSISESDENPISKRRKSDETEPVTNDETCVLETSQSNHGQENVDSQDKCSSAKTPPSSDEGLSLPFLTATNGMASI